MYEVVTYETSTPSDKDNTLKRLSLRQRVTVHRVRFCNVFCDRCAGHQR